MPVGPLGQPLPRAKSTAKPGSKLNPRINKNLQKYTGAKDNAISGDVVNYLKEELLATWTAYSIPDFHRYAFLDCIYGLKPNQYSPIIVKEIEDLQNEKAPIQNAIRAIIARESCITQVLDLEMQLRETDERNIQMKNLGIPLNDQQGSQGHF